MKEITGIGTSDAAANDRRPRNPEASDARAQGVIDLKSGNEAVVQLGRRFALRLDAALDACGYPVLKASRQRALANALALDVTTVTTFASGLQLPDYCDLLALCSL